MSKLVTKAPASKYVPGPNVVAFKRLSELEAGETFPQFPPGMYKFSEGKEPKDDGMDMMAMFIKRDPIIQIEKSEMTSDEIIDLPSPAYTQAVKELESFLSPATRQTYKHLGFLYKRSWLFHGIPGTGKSVLVKKFAQNIIQRGGFVLTNIPGIVGNSINKYFHPVNNAQTMAIIIEEFEGLQDNSATLTAMDGGNQRENMIFLCTTNYIEKIPPRMLRPGRIHSKIEVGPLPFEARLAYLSTKIEDGKLARTSAEVSEGLVIDELKELVQQTVLLGVEPLAAVKSLLAFRESATKNFYDPEKDPTIEKVLTYTKEVFHE